MSYLPWASSQIYSTLLRINKQTHTYTIEKVKTNVFLLNIGLKAGQKAKVLQWINVFLREISSKKDSKKKYPHMEGIHKIQ